MLVSLSIGKEIAKNLVDESGAKDWKVASGIHMK